MIWTLFTSLLYHLTLFGDLCNLKKVTCLTRSSVALRHHTTTKGKRTFLVRLSEGSACPDESASSARPPAEPRRASFSGAWTKRVLQRVCACRPPYKTPTADNNGFSGTAPVIPVFLWNRWLQLRIWASDQRAVRLRCSAQSSGLRMSRRLVPETTHRDANTSFPVVFQAAAGDKTAQFSCSLLRCHIALGSDWLKPVTWPRSANHRWMRWTSRTTPSFDVTLKETFK